MHDKSAYFETLNARSIDITVCEISGLPPDQKQLIFRPASPNRISQPFTDEELGYRNLAGYPCHGTPEPRKLYELVRSLETSARRDAELANIVVEAICVADEPFAFEIFAGLSAADQKDRAARDVAAFYIHKKRFADASKWAAFLSNSQDKEWWTRRILEASQAKN